jgi:hypothetical protein
MAPSVEARIMEMRVVHPGWGRTIGHWLARRRGRSGAGPVVARPMVARRYLDRTVRGTRDAERRWPAGLEVDEGRHAAGRAADP